MSVGTAAAIRGISETLRRRDGRVRIVAVEPAESAVLSGGVSGSHKIDGIGADPMEKYRKSGHFTPFTAIINVTGQPAINLPLYWNDEGLPIGVQFVAVPIQGGCAQDDVEFAVLGLGILNRHHLRSGFSHHIHQEAASNCFWPA